MNFSTLIADSWTLTWRYKFLWVLGFFAAGSAAQCTASSVRQGVDRSSQENIQQQLTDGGTSWAEVQSNTSQWISDNLALAVLITSLVVLVGVILFFLNCIAVGGLNRTLSNIIRGQPVTLSLAWRDGLRLVWRYAAFALLQSVVAVLLLVAAVLTYTAIGLRTAALVGLITLAVSVPYGIVVAIAQCAIAANDDGVVGSLARSIQLFRQRLGACLLAWLVQIVVIIAATVAAVIAVVIALLLALLFGQVAGDVLLVVYLVFMGVSFIGLFAVIGAVADTWAWAYWMLAYVRLTSDEAGPGGDVPVQFRR